MIRRRNRIAEWRLGFAVAISLWVFTAALAAESAAPTEGKAVADRERVREKGEIVFELVRFVDWPAPGAEGSALPFVIGVLGDERWGAAIRKAASGSQIRGRPVVTRSFRNLDEVDPCSVLVVGRSKARYLPTILEFLEGGRGILTIGDRAGFADGGGVVELVELPDRIGFEVNRDAARQAGLELGAQILRLAERLLPESDAAPTR